LAVPTGTLVSQNVADRLGFRTTEASGNP